MGPSETNKEISMTKSERILMDQVISTFSAIEGFFVEATEFLVQHTQGVGLALESYVDREDQAGSQDSASN